MLLNWISLVVIAFSLFFGSVTYFFLWNHKRNVKMTLVFVSILMSVSVFFALIGHVAMQDSIRQSQITNLKFRMEWQLQQLDAGISANKSKKQLHDVLKSIQDTQHELNLLENDGDVDE